MTDQRLMQQAGIQVPLICGAMYPCSNPELVAAVSDAGGLGIVQPLSLTYVHGHEFREGLRYIRSLTPRPVGMNALIEQTSRHYRERMGRWLDIALEEGIRFFITSLGNPRWVVDRVRPAGGVVYHDVTERKWALKGRDGGVQGLVAVNKRAGGHAGALGPRQLMDQLGDLGLPVVCAGGIGEPRQFREALDMGYAGAQLGTRFIATVECSASDEYKRAILDADESDVVLTERLTGLPVSVLNNGYVRRLGTRASPLARWLLRHRRTKYWMRSVYARRSEARLRRSLHSEDTSREYWQAGKSVAQIHDVRPAGEIVGEFAKVLVHL